MKCPSNSCVWRSRDGETCIAPLDVILTKHCPIPPEIDAKLTEIKAIYPNSPLLWGLYLEHLEKDGKLP